MDADRPHHQDPWKLAPILGFGHRHRTAPLRDSVAASLGPPNRDVVAASASPVCEGFEQSVKRFLNPNQP